MFRELFEGKKFHPIDVFQERWVVTDGKEIVGENGEAVSFKQFKEWMKKMKRHDQYDYIFFPTEKLADENLESMRNSLPSGFEVKKLSYA